MKERIAKFLANAGVCSRREAERYIADGRVSVNNGVIDTPVTLVDGNDLVVVDGMPVDKPKRARVFLYHKPVDVIVTSKDPEGRKTLDKALPKGLPRLMPVGRLDINSEGLLLLTTHGDLAQWLMRPTGAGWKRIYKVRVYGRLEDWQLKKMQRGMMVDGVQYRGADVRLVAGKGRNVWYQVTLTEGKNREVRKMFAAFGIMVSRLIRLQYGPYLLGDIPAGRVVELPVRQVEALMGEMGEFEHAS